MKTQQPTTPWNDLTLNVALWLERDPASFEAWHSMAEEVLALSKLPQEQIDDPATELAHRLRNAIREIIPRDAADVIVSIIHLALYDVDWVGIARALIDDVAEDDEGPDSEPTDDAPFFIAAFPDGAKFPLGRLIVTEGASWTIDARDIREAISRHLRGDWGVCDSEDWQRNQQALHEGSRLFSVYRTVKNDVYWIITEANRSVTTVLLPSEY